jgi:hypothetical protein
MTNLSIVLSYVDCAQDKLHYVKSLELFIKQHLNNLFVLQPSLEEAKEEKCRDIFASLADGIHNAQFQEDPDSIQNKFGPFYLIVQSGSVNWSKVQMCDLTLASLPANLPENEMKLIYVIKHGRKYFHLYLIIKEISK